MASEIRSVRVRYVGRVQGVGFRYTVMQIARRFPVTGHVMNRRDGSVALVAEGLRPRLQAFLDAIAESHLGPGIRDRHEEWGPATGAFRDFSIRRSE